MHGKSKRQIGSLYFNGKWQQRNEKEMKKKLKQQHVENGIVMCVCGCRENLVQKIEKRENNTFPDFVTFRSGAFL